MKSIACIKKVDELTKKKNEIEIMEIKHNEEIQAMRRSNESDFDNDTTQS